LCEGDKILPRDLPQEVLKRKTVGKADRGRGNDRFELPVDGINFENFERELIVQAMEKPDRVIAKAAKLRGMSYRTLQYRLDKFELSKPDAKGTAPPPAAGAKP